MARCSADWNVCWKSMNLVKGFDVLVSGSQVRARIDLVGCLCSFRVAGSIILWLNQCLHRRITQRSPAKAKVFPAKNWALWWHWILLVVTWQVACRLIRVGWLDCSQGISHCEHDEIRFN